MNGARHNPAGEALSPHPGSNALRALDVMNGHGRIELRTQQRLARTAVSKQTLIVLRHGMLAIDASPPGGERQILDFLLPGDVISGCMLLACPMVSVRAITQTSLVLQQPKQENPVDLGPDYWARCFAQSQMQLARANIHRVIIGRLKVEARVASFLYSLALRQNENATAGAVELQLPMSRSDIANYLAMNSDTLSRIMMRLEGAGALERRNRHVIRVPEIAGIAALTPIAPMLSAVYDINVQELTHA